jgi:hypothetical protein
MTMGDRRQLVLLAGLHKKRTTSIQASRAANLPTLRAAGSITQSTNTPITYFASDGAFKNG